LGIMKNFVVFVLLTFLSFGALAQSDSTTFSNEQVLRISNKIKELEQRDSLNNILISELKLQNQELKNYIQRDSLLLSLKNEEIALREHQVNLYLDLYKTSKPKWYEHKTIWFGLGMGTVIFSSWVVANTTP